MPPSFIDKIITILNPIKIPLNRLIMRFKEPKNQPDFGLKITALTYSHLKIETKAVADKLGISIKIKCLWEWVWDEFGDKETKDWCRGVYRKI